MINELSADELFSKLILQEEILADYYVYLRGVIPEFRSVWDFLEKEEKGHAKALTALKDEFKNRKIEINSRVFGMKTVEYSLSKIQTESESIKLRPHTKLELLELALIFEANTLDSIIFETISSEYEIIDKKLKWLQETTRNHEAILKDAIKEHKERIAENQK